MFPGTEKSFGISPVFIGITPSIIADLLGLMGRELARQTKSLEQYGCGHTPSLIMPGP